MRLRALRGATTVAENTTDAILDGTEELLRAILERNQLAGEDLVSCIFTTTDDLDAEFPAVAARRIGLSSVPLLGAREMNRPGALQRVIRVLVHCYADPARPAQHVYLRDAVTLRQDLQGAQ
jgi:chorismate mutase